MPQILRALDILQYSSQLSNTIDSLIEVPFGSSEEIELRACTVIAVERIRERLSSRRAVHLLVIEVDWLLWQQGEAKKDVIAPHHRTLTIYY